MNIASGPPLAELTATAIRILCREMGVANTARFLGQFSLGLGNYTDERDRIIGDPTLDEIFADIDERRREESTAVPPAGDGR